jgi:bifunctional non-homologous end joining protein LigD
MAYVAAGRTHLDVDGHSLSVSNLDKVLYPDGTTKHDVITHYVEVADVLLPLLAGRPATRKRWPNGTAASSFFEKNMPRGAPSWIRTVTLESPGSTRDRERITYPVLQGLADLVWVANLAALELHVPQWRVGPRGGVRAPDRLVVDLDPGEGAGLAQCAEVACTVRELLHEDGLEAVPVTSGSKGMQLYAPVAGTQDAGVVRAYANVLAERGARQLPGLVVTRMTKAIRGGKVLIDWSQNTAAKTTITPWSLRGRDRGTLACPRTWDEIQDPETLEQVHRSEVADRLATYGDLTAALLEKGPRLPAR